MRDMKDMDHKPMSTTEDINEVSLYIPPPAATWGWMCTPSVSIKFQSFCNPLSNLLVPYLREGATVHQYPGAKGGGGKYS